MRMNRKIARASAALSAAALLGAAPAMAQETDPFAACRAAGTPTGIERSLCYRSAANLANEQVPPAPVTRPLVIDGTGFDWTDAGVGFAAAAGLALLGAGTAVAVRSRRLEPSPHGASRSRLDP
jgi:hypothetical protein